MRARPAVIAVAKTSAFWSRFLSAQAGATAIEYGLIAVAMAVAVALAVANFGDAMEIAFKTMGDVLTEKAAEI